METNARYVLMGLFTTAVVLAGFGVVFWMNSSGGLGERSTYEIRFEEPVAGLRPGSAVLFNGIRVGEVTALRLSPANPRQVEAAISVDKATPVRADTEAGMDFQGLIGGASISLKGGSPALPLLSGRSGNPPVLTASRRASQDLTQTARDAVARIDQVLADNADALRDTLANLQTFTAALARNSSRIDGLFAGLESLSGVGPPKPIPVIYDLTAPRTFPLSGKPPGGQLAVAEPTALLLYDTQRILVRPAAADGTPPFPNAQWSDTLPKLLHAKLIQTFENAGRLAAVGRSTDAPTAEHQLLIDLRQFQISASAERRGEIEFSAKLVAEGGRILRAQVFHAAVPTKAPTAEAAASALDEAFAKTAIELVVWVSDVM